MRILTNIFLVLLVLGVARLNTYTKSPDLTPAESNVLRTITYGVGSGLLINTVCGIAAPSLDPEIPSSDSFMSCAPFGIGGSLIVARIYVFTTGGWGLEHWWYLNQLPKLAENGIRGVLGLNHKPQPVKPVFPVKQEQIPVRSEL
ncbi:hypothetical protein SUNI508_13234 [Seiridium unicorne]|uniref:Uncharacterized protein n=1 Tax=Seiridium unicorne TaxID=138068 RepID=A0ABR2VDK7_9PEZI